MNIKIEPIEVDVDEQLCVPDRSSSSSNTPPNDINHQPPAVDQPDLRCHTIPTGDRNSPPTGQQEFDDRSRPAHHQDQDQDCSVHLSSRLKVKLETVLPPLSVSRSTPMMQDSNNVSVTPSGVVNQNCDDVIAATSLSRDVLRGDARPKTTESSISKLESFVASLNQQTRDTRRDLSGITSGPSSSVTTTLPWSAAAAIGHPHIATIAGGGCYDRRMTLPTSPIAALAAGYVGGRVAAGPSAACYRAPVAMVTSTSLPSGCSNGAEVVLKSAGRRDEPLDLSTKKTTTTTTTSDELRFNQDESTGDYFRQSENISKGHTVGHLERRQNAGARRLETSGPSMPSANSLACLERDFGENSALLNRIGSLTQLRHVQHGLAEFVAQQNAARLPQQQPHLDRRQPQPSRLVQSFQRPSINSPSLGAQLNATYERSLSNVAPCVVRSDGVVLPVPHQHPSLSAATNSSSMIGQLLSINVPNAIDQATTWSRGLSQLCAGVRDDRHRTKQQHHQQQQQQPRRATPGGHRDRQSPADPTATVSTLKCLECSGRFSSLPELTLHMIQAGHYANIVRAEDGSLTSPAYNSWNDRLDIVNKLSTTRWRHEIGGPTSPTPSLDDESISSTCPTESRSGCSMSPIKSPALSTSSLSPPRCDEKTDGDKELMSGLLAGVDPNIAKNMILGQSNMFNGSSMNNGSSATAAVAAFGMVIKSMKKYIECSLNQSVIDVDWKSNGTAKHQRRPHHNHRRHPTHQTRRDAAMMFDDRGKKLDRENPSSMHTRRKNSSSSSTSDSFDATDGAKKNCNLPTASMKRSLIDCVEHVPDKRRATENDNGSPSGPVSPRCSQSRDGNTRHKLADNLTTRTSIVSTSTTQSVFSKRSSLPLISEAPVTPSRSSSSPEVDVVCSSLDLRPTMTSPTTSLCTPSTGGATSVTAVTASQFKNIDNISISSPSLPQPSATTTTTTTAEVNCGGRSDDNEYTSRFGKYCRLARELAGRAN